MFSLFRITCFKEILMNDQDPKVKSAALEQEQDLSTKKELETPSESADSTSVTSAQPSQVAAEQEPKTAHDDRPQRSTRPYVRAVRSYTRQTYS